MKRLRRAGWLLIPTWLGLATYFFTSAHTWSRAWAWVRSEPWWPVSAGDDQEALREVQALHRHAVQSLRTLSCRASTRWDPPSTSSNYSFQYWRDQDKVRINYQGGHGTTETLADAHRLVSLWRHTGGREDAGAAIRARTSADNFRGDAWSMALLHFTGPTGGSCSLDTLLAGPHTIQHLKRVTEEGRSLLNLRLKHESAELELWFDPQVNSLVRRKASRMVIPGAPDSYSESRVLEFIELTPGIFFPKQVEGRNYNGQTLRSTGTVTFSDIKVNKPIPSDVFKIRFPRGTMVGDQILGKVYTVDEDGNSLGPMKTSDGREFRLAPLSPPVTVLTPPPPTVTQVEPESWTRWLLPGSLAVLLAACALWFYRKWRPVAA